MNDTSHLDLFAVLSSRTPLLQAYLYLCASQPASQPASQITDCLHGVV